MQFGGTGKVAKVLLTILISVIIAVAAYYIIITLVVDPYLQNGTWKLISNNFEVYNNGSLQDTPKIYFIGNSQIMEAVDPAVIQEGLSSKNVSYSVYNLGVNFDTPLQRSIGALGPDTVQTCARDIRGQLLLLFQPVPVCARTITSPWYPKRSTLTIIPDPYLMQINLLSSTRANSINSFSSVNSLYQA